MRSEMIGICCCLLAVAAVAADPAPRVPQTKSEIDQQLAALTRRQVELAFTLRDQVQKNDTLWMDPKYTSPEIEKLRKRMNELKKEMIGLQMALRDRVAEIPEAKAEIEKVEKGKAEHQSLARQIEELRKQREQAP